MRTRTLFAAAALAAVTLLAACGDDSSGGAADTTVAAAADTTIGAGIGSGTDPVTSDTGSGAPTGPGKDTEFCLYQQELNDMTTPFDDSNSDAADFEKYFNEMVSPAIDKLQDTAPDEIKEQMDILAAGLRRFAVAFEKNEWDPAKAYADPDLQALAQDATYNAAGEAVDTYCGF